MTGTAALPTAEARRTFLRLAGYLRPYLGLFAASLAAMLLSALFDAFSLVLLIPFLDSLFGTGAAVPDNAAERLIQLLVGRWIVGATPLESLRNICLVVLAAIVLKNVTLYAARVLAVMVQERMERDMRDGVYAHLQRLPLGFFGGEKVGQLLARVLNDTRQAKWAVSYALSDALKHAVTVLAYLAALFALSWRLTLLALLLAPLLVGALRPLMRRLRRGFRRAYDHQGELLSVLQETVSGIRLVKAFGAEGYERRRFEERSGRFLRQVVRAESMRQLASPLSEILSACVALALLWIGAVLVLDAATLGPAEFLTFITIALRFISPVKALAEFPTRAQAALAAADRFFEVLDAAPEPLEGGGGRRAEAPRREIRFEDVWFEYEPGRPVLRRIDLVVGRGEVVALVGPSGAGKSTLVDLLPRFIEPTRGRITLDGVDLREMSLRSLRELFGIVSQETVIFHDTVRANIAYGDGRRWREPEIRAAARTAHAEEFIRDLPLGYDTPLGDRGVRLSGGQRQRIGLARALLRDPPILILDEATSALDSESERLIQDALEQLLRGRTVFVIAHRLSTVLGADRIVVLDEGRIAGSGTHAELLSRGGVYRRLFELQFAAAPA